MDSKQTNGLTAINLHLPLFLLATLGLGSMVPAPGLAQIETPSTILQVEGSLEPGDAQFEDGSFYDEYQFEAEADQAVVITLESDEFDTYLLLFNEAGDSIAANDDFADVANSQIGIVLPEGGTYQVRANAYSADAQGAYNLIVELSVADDPRVRRSEAERLKAQGVEQFNQANYPEALDFLQQALAIFQEIDDRISVGGVLNNIGFIYSRQGDYPKALDYYQQSLIVRQEISDRNGEATALNNIGSIYEKQGNYAQALDYYQQALGIRREISDRNGEAATLNNIGFIYSRQSDYPQALDHYQQSLAIIQDTDDRSGQAVLLNNIGDIHSSQGDYPQALDHYQQSLAIMQAINDRYGEGIALNSIGSIYSYQGDYPQALTYYQQALTIFQDIGDRSGEGGLLNNIGDIYASQGDYPQALDYYQRSLAIVQAIGDRSSEGAALNNIGDLYSRQGDYPLALDYYQRSLEIVQALGDRSSEGIALNNIGGIYSSQGNYPQALDYYQQFLAIAQGIGDRSSEEVALNNIGDIYSSQGEYQQALDYHQRSLEIVQALGDRSGEAGVLNNIGFVYARQGDYPQALDYYQQSLTILQKIGDRSREEVILNNIGFVYNIQGDYPQALEYYQRSLAIVQAVGNRQSEGVVLNNIGRIYNVQENYLQALDYYQQSLEIVQVIGDRSGEGVTLNNIGGVYDSQGNYPKALDYYQQSLAIRQAIGDRSGEGATLNNIGLIYDQQGNYAQALNYYQKSLTIVQGIGDPLQEAALLTNLGHWFEQQEKPALAVTFLKQSINTYEKIRTNNQGFSEELQYLQQSYTNTVADNYRFLASLLLEQGRIPEAQQVLDLLQLEELREFTDTRAVWTSDGIRLSSPEQTVADAHGSLMALGRKLVECERNNCNDLNSLYDQQETLLAQYDTEVERFVETIRSNRRDDAIFQDLDNISGEAQSLLDAYAAEGQNTLLVYPFVLEDKLWLVWVTVGDVVGSIEVPVSQGELATTVQQFGTLLNSRSSDLNELQATSQKLHNWIIQPIAAELEQNNIDHLVFVNDRVTRYIPMGALYDGENYLLERYTVSTVLAPGATDMSDRISSVADSNILGLGLTEAVENFTPLPAVRDELAAIIKGQNSDGIYPGQAFLNKDFTFDTFKNNVQGNRILHIATHAAFEPGRPEESFIVLGDGSRMTIPDIETMQRRLRNLHLVVLSACQTALGGTNQEDGSEITGLSSYFLEANRAEAVVASLWAVNDTSTSVLMQRFYQNLAAGETKADALRRAQLSLLDSVDQPSSGDERIISQRPSGERETTSLSHPYYWAPFILIGNGL